MAYYLPKVCFNHMIFLPTKFTPHLLMIALLFSCSSAAEPEEFGSLTGIWASCSSAGYVELYCKSGQCLVGFGEPNAKVKFYYEIVKDTLYTTLRSKTELQDFLIINATKDHFDLARKENPKVIEMNCKRIQNINIDLWNIGDNVYKQMLYAKAFKARKAMYHCPGDTTKIPITDLGTINWAEFDIDTLDN